MYRSEIRPSSVSNLLDKVQGRNYGRYLRKMVLTKVRGLENALISFDFPVTALIGPNGGGKTTVLGAAGCAYRDIKPRQFFARSGNLDESMRIGE